MAIQTIEATDTLNEGRVKVNANFVDVQNITTASVTGAASLDATAFNKLHLLSGTSADYTVDLPTAVGNAGGIVAFKGVAALTKVITLAGVSGQTIDAEANRKISTLGLIVLMSDGTNWTVVNEVGSWINYTPVYTGFSADPTHFQTEYFRQGKLCTVKIISLASGTSNASTFTITLPFNAANLSYGVCEITFEGSTATIGVIATRSSSNIADIYKTIVGSTWATSGNKRASFTLTYKMQ